jgi:hypothetical protein
MPMVATTDVSRGVSVEGSQQWGSFDAWLYEFVALHHDETVIAHSFSRVVRVVSNNSIDTPSRRLDLFFDEGLVRQVAQHRMQLAVKPTREDVQSGPPGHRERLATADTAYPRHRAR